MRSTNWLVRRFFGQPSLQKGECLKKRGLFNGREVECEAFTKCSSFSESK
jgi:hypothetical protein